MHAAILLGEMDTTTAIVELLPEFDSLWPAYFGCLLLTAAGVWATFVKAGQRGWTCLVPIYNLMAVFKIIRKSMWWSLLFLVPGVNFVLACFVGIRLARHFGKGIGFGLGLVFFPYVFYPLIGFGSATYRALLPKADLPSPVARSANVMIRRKAG